MRSDIRQAVSALARNPNEEKAWFLPGFGLNDVYAIFKPYFNYKAQQAFDNKTSGHMYHENRMILTPGLGSFLKKLGFKSCQKHEAGIFDTKFYKVRVCASRADKATVYKAVEKIIRTVNELADKGYMRACYMPLSVTSIQLVDGVEPEYIAFSYFFLTAEGEHYAMTNMPNMWVEDDNMMQGMIPERYENQ